MLLTISTNMRPATDLGYLLAKNPTRVQTFDLAFGRAHVLYPEATEERCEVALLLDIDSLTLVKGREGTRGGGALDDYVNDRPYVASSFLSTAIRDVFGSALKGQSKERPELAQTPIPLTVTISALPCRRGSDLIEKLFEPLGYTVICDRLPLDSAFPDWGDSDYYKVTLYGTVTLQRLLQQLFVLIPVLDNSKHYEVTRDEVQKLLKHGDGWLEGHPLKDLVVKRYLGYQNRFVDAAQRELTVVVQEEPAAEAGETEGESQPEVNVVERKRLHEQRHDEVLAVVLASGAESLLDLGCGGGKFLVKVLPHQQFKRVTGVEPSQEEIIWAKRRLKLRAVEAATPGRLTIEQGSLTYRMTHLTGFDAAVLIEVIEHIDPDRLPQLVAGIFGDARPKMVVLTTPNREYNVRYPFLKAGELRHRDHRFEWTRAEFAEFADKVAADYGYTVRYGTVGEIDPEVGASSQMAVFERASAECTVPPSAMPAGDHVLSLRELSVPLAQSVRLREGHVRAAFETMSRFAVDPRWLVYLPPTMSPCEAAPEGELLEHPMQAFQHYLRHGVRYAIMEEKHMGSRAIVVVARSKEAAARRFGVTDGKQGVCYTRTGQPFFQDAEMEAELVSRTANAIGKAGLWDELGTDWLVLDCEIMPWSAKARGLIRFQYAGMAAAADGSFAQALDVLSRAKASGLPVDELTARTRLRKECVVLFRDAYRRYCWTTNSLSDYRVAPFHILAGEGKLYTDKSHHWHMETIKRLADNGGDNLVRSTSYMLIDLQNADMVAAAIQLWMMYTGAGNEGMVVKPLAFTVTDERGLVQPGVKVRGREYLRIIYGPEYTEPHQLERLRKRNLSSKRALAVREYALGVEALRRFVAGEPLASVHECVFGVLALESEPMDPRL